MSVRRTDAWAAAVGGRIYVYGGSSDDTGFAAVRVDFFRPRLGNVAARCRCAALLGRLARRGDWQPGSDVQWLPGALARPWRRHLDADCHTARQWRVHRIGGWTHGDGTTDVVVMRDPGVAYLSVTLNRYSVANDVCLPGWRAG
jgi:hypothetical protein